MFNQIYDAATY